MKRAMASVAFLFVIAGSVCAETGELRASTPAVRKEIVATIDAQLAALRRHDMHKAYGYAAAALQAQRPLPLFTAIVQSSYPELWSNRRAEFGIVRDDGNNATVLVRVFGDQGSASYDYTLVKEQSAWRVQDVLRHDSAGDDQL